MRLRSKIIICCLGACVCGVLALIIFIHITSSPSFVLKRDLNIASLPPTIKSLEMGADEWQDVLHCFHFKLAPSDFSKLLTGRQFEIVDQGGPMQVATIRINPVRSMKCNIYYQWEKSSAKCTIYVNDARDEAIVLYSVRLTGP